MIFYNNNNNNTADRNFIYNHPICKIFYNIYKDTHLHQAFGYFIFKISESRTGQQYFAFLEHPFATSLYDYIHVYLF